MKRYAVILATAAAALAIAFGASAIANPASPARASAPLKAATAAPVKTIAAPTTPQVRPAEEAHAAEVLGKLQATYRYLDDVTVSMGSTPENHQAIAYYTEGQIVISPAHTASIDKILAHEVWHVIDWRDNGRLDWGENLPPAEASDYLR
jgi:hypothetical protein